MQGESPASSAFSIISSIGTSWREAFLFEIRATEVRRSECPIRLTYLGPEWKGGKVGEKKVFLASSHSIELEGNLLDPNEKVGKKRKGPKHRFYA